MTQYLKNIIGYYAITVTTNLRQKQSLKNTISVSISIKWPECTPNLENSEIHYNNRFSNFKIIWIQSLICEHVNEWNYRWICNQGFVYDTSTQECQQLKGLNGFCTVNENCDGTRKRELVCIEKSCKCTLGFTNINVIDGCESNERIKERDSQTRKMMYLFIGSGFFFGVALSSKFGAFYSSSAHQLLLKRIVE